jgi:hypothetical protein
VVVQEADLLDLPKLLEQMDRILFFQQLHPLAEVGAVAQMQTLLVAVVQVVEGLTGLPVGDLVGLEIRLALLHHRVITAALEQAPTLAAEVGAEQARLEQTEQVEAAVQEETELHLHFQGLQ